MTSVIVDDELVSRAIEVSGMKTKEEVVKAAISEFLETRGYREMPENTEPLNLLDLVGKVKFAEGYDYKALRRSRFDDLD